MGLELWKKSEGHRKCKRFVWRTGYRIVEKYSNCMKCPSRIKNGLQNTFRGSKGTKKREKNQ